jgi:hypothetical protein
MWRRERGESKKAPFASLGHSADDSERDRRGEADGDSDADSSSAVVSSTPAVKGSSASVAPVAASAAPAPLTHGESLAPAKLLAIASDPEADGPSAAAPAGSAYVSSPTALTPTTPLSASGPGANNHPRQMSTGESLWSLQASDDETSDDDLGFETPDEGLSEVGEEEEEEATPSTARFAAPATSPVPVVAAAAVAAGVAAPKSISDGPPQAAALPHAVDSSTAAAVAIPPSTTDHPLERTTTNPVPEAYRPSASVDQAAILDDDLRMCHRVMDLFLNSHIAEAENVVKDGDPQRERLYYQVADAILCTLKVRHRQEIRAPEQHA